MFPWLTACCMAALLCGCGEDNAADAGMAGTGNGQQQTAARVPLRLQTVRTETGGTAGNGVTRAGVPSTTDLSTATAVGFFMQDPSTPAIVLYANRKGTFDTGDGHWKPVSDQMIWVDNRTSTLAAYAPYNSATSYSSRQLPLTSALYAADGSNDLLAARFTATNASIAAGLDVTLSHVYTRLVFTFVKNSGYTSELKLNKLELSGKDIFSAGSYDLFAETYAAGTGEPKKITATVNLTVPATATPVPATAKADLLLIPVNNIFTEDALLEVYSTDGKHMKVAIPQSTFTMAQPFAPGKQYNFTVKLSPAEMTITRVEVNDWESGTTATEEVKFDS